MEINDVKMNCRNYLGDRPCKPHKDGRVDCLDCKLYDPIEEKILVIKLNAAGDVIRTTPLLRKIKEEMPHSHITWVSNFPELLPSQVDYKIRSDNKSLLWLSKMQFDIVYNLDKDPTAIALMELIEAKKKYGFGMDRYGHCYPLNESAEHKLLTGLFDDISRNNKKSYVEEIFEICGFNFSGEKYLLEKTVERNWNLSQPSPVVGLNTGCGAKWTSRLWPSENWITLAQCLAKKGIGIIWLGGRNEHEKNKQFYQRGFGFYPGYFSLEEFVDLIDQCDVIVTQVTMTLHIAIALQKRVVLMNNIFNKYEFELYGLGEIIEPSEKCECYYSQVCPHDSMKKISPFVVLDAVLRQM
jgi:heptosyltransferase-2